MAGRRVVLAEYLGIGNSILLFGVRTDWDQPEIVEFNIDDRELALFAEANFGSHRSVRDMIELGMEELWHGYDRLIEPLGRWAEPDDIVCLIPHRQLHYLPLHALKVDGSYLIERNAVVYSPSVSVLKHCLSMRPSGPSGLIRRKAAVFGDSREDLPAARAEAAMLAGLLGAEPILGGRVTRENLLRGAAEADILHVAGHAQFSHAKALDSGLELAGTDVLTAADVFGSDAMNTYLVTLSGCETGVSQNHPGDELIGLTRAFLYARTSSVLVSLWEVADASTAFLMRRFYTHLLNHPDGLKADALRQAMLDTMAEPRWAAFYYWAPFVMIGDWR